MTAAIIGIRGLLMVAASAAVLAGAPTAVTTALTGLAVAVAVERLARTRARSRVDAVLVGSGGTLITLILVGLLLGVSGIGLSATSWAIGLGVVGLLGLGAAEYHGRKIMPSDQQDTTAPEPARPRIGRMRDLPWALAIVAVVIGALSISVRATDRADVAPLQMSFGAVHGTTAEVLVSSDRPSGRLELRTQAEDGTSLSYPLFSVEPGRPMTAAVTLPASGRFVITLNNPDQTEPLRSLILDR